jgi:uncharacterized membrane protein YhaH (DUF805 family)
MFKVFSIIGLLLLGLLTALSGIWGALAFIYLGPTNEILRNILVAVFSLTSFLTIIGFAFRRWRWKSFISYIVIFLAVLTWYSSISPSNTRQWQEDVAILPYATRKGNLITMHNIRNFDYRSEMEYTPAYYDKSFDLNKLEGIDIIAVYWMGPAIAHVFLSFEFAGDDHLAISIETRKEKEESYSTLRGFFRQYELYYVVADERDVIRLRTNYRFNPPEDVYVYRASGDIEEGRRLFLSYIDKINGLKSTPEFYNTLTSNCTTDIWYNAQINPENIPFSWKILASGYLPEYLYENGRLDTKGLSFSQLQESVHINKRAQAINTKKDFSVRIRKPFEIEAK